MKLATFTTRYTEEYADWCDRCEMLGITIDDRGCGHLILTVPPGVAVPDPPPESVMLVSTHE